MDKRTLNELRTIIEQQRAALADAVRTNLLSGEPLGDMQGIGESIGDEGDQSVRDFTSEMILQRSVTEGQNLAATQHALDRIARGEYGVCMDCGEDIPVERLRVQPTAMRCVRDQTIFEQVNETHTPKL